MTFQLPRPGQGLACVGRSGVRRRSKSPFIRASFDRGRRRPAIRGRRLLGPLAKAGSGRVSDARRSGGAPSGRACRSGCATTHPCRYGWHRVCRTATQPRTRLVRPPMSVSLFPAGPSFGAAPRRSLSPGAATHADHSVAQVCGVPGPADLRSGHQWRVHHHRCGPVHPSGPARAIPVAGGNPHDPG